MGTEQQSFQLKWQNYESNLRNVFDKFLSAQAFLDVTVVCNSLNMKVHKAVLSAASPYLQDILINNPCPHPIIILQDLDEAGLECLIDFIYKGEVHVTPERLSALLKCAEALRITGVIDACTRTVKTEADDDQQSPLLTYDTTGGIDQTAPSITLQHHFELDHSDHQISLPPPEDMPGRSADEQPLQMGTATDTAGGPSNGHKKRKRRRKSTESLSPSAEQSSSSRLDPPAAHSPWTIAMDAAGSVIGSVSYRSEFDEHCSDSGAGHEPMAPRLQCGGALVPVSLAGVPGRTLDGGGGVHEERGVDVIHISSDLDTRSPAPNEAPSVVGIVGGVGGEDFGNGGANSSAGSSSRQQFVCQVCGKSLCSRFKLKEHEEIHNPFRQTYSCTYCCRVYQHRTDLYRHHRKSHPDKPPPPHRRQMS